MKRLIKLSLLLACVLGAPLLLGDSVDALANTEPASPTTFGVGGVGDQFNAPTSVTRLYVPNNDDGSVTIWSNNYIRFGDLNVYAVNGGNCNLGNWVAGFNTTSAFTLSTLSATQGGINGGSPDTITANGTTYRIYCVVVGSYGMPVMRFRLTGGPGQLIGNDVSLNSGTTGYLGSENPTSSSPQWSRELDFAPNCGLGESNHDIWFYDLDLDSSFQSPINPMVAQVRQTAVSPNDNYGTLGSDAPGSPQNYTTGPENETRSMSVTFNQGGARKYRLNLGPIAGNNAIKIALPFDQIYTIIDCPIPNPNPPGGTIHITCDVNTSVLTIWVDVSDLDAGDTLSVSVNVSGIGNLTGSRTGSGTINLGTRQGAPGGGYSASGTVSDGAHTGNLTGASVTCNRPPSGTLTISCNPDTAVLSISASVTDGDGGNLSVSASINGGASPGSASGSRNGSGAVTLSPSTVQGQFGATHTISGTVTDAAGATRGMTADSTSCPALVWITGRLKNAYTPTYDDYNGVTIQTCRPAGVPSSPQTATSDPNGYFAFRVPSGRGFCVRVDATTLPAGAARQARPQYEAYQGCGPFDASAATPAPGYCAAYNSYENQVAGTNGGGIDRTTNDGYDFALRFPPRITCRFEPAITGIIGVGTTVAPVVRINNVSTVYEASPATGSSTFRFEGRADETQNYGSPTPLDRGRNTGTSGNPNSPVVPDVAFTTFVVNTPGDYTVTATATATGDGLSAAAVDCTGGGEANVGLFPYLREFGGDVGVGGNFLPGACSPPTGLPGNIFAYNLLTGSGANEHYVGSSAQYTVQALLNINGFASESMRNKNVAAVTGRPAKGLSFSNTTGDSTYGGAYGASLCMTDYYASTIATPEDTDISTSSTDFPVVGPATPEPIYGDVGTQSVPVPATSAAGATVTVNPGTQYRITAYGTFSYGSAGARVADARCSRDSAAAPWSASGPAINSLRMNGAIVPWGTDGATGMPGSTDPSICTSNNSYVYIYTATTASLQFTIQDSNYTDNSGAVTVAIAPVMSVTASSSSPPSPDLRPEDVVDGIKNQWNWGEWASNAQLAGGAACSGSGCPWIQLDLGSSRTVGRVNIYDRINQFDHVTSGVVTLYNAAGTALASQSFGSLGNTTGAALPVNFPVPINAVRRVRVTITSAAPSTFNAGLAEIEVPPITGYLPITSAAPPGRHQFHYSGSRTIGDGNDILIPSGSQTAIFVNDGDLYIRSNIRLADNYTGIANMPYFAMIVKGNIYIDKDVTRLDGLFVSQPRTDGTGGTIYTCGRDNGSAYEHYGPNAASGLDIFTQCNRQLSINGSVVAKRIKWLRILNNISVSRPGDATFGEAYSPETGAGTNASEVVNYTPQMWLAPSPLKLPGSTTDGVSDPASPSNAEPYQYIRALPPIL